MSREQLPLFEFEEDKKIILGVDKVDISTLPDDPYREDYIFAHQFNELPPNKFFIHKTGGLHANPDYHHKGKIFPYVTSHIKDKIKIVSLRLSWSDPYYKSTLHIKDGKYMTPKIHRLVAFAFIKKPDNPKYKIVDHIDRDITNYHVDNLRWVTNSMNNTNRSKNNKEMEIELAKTMKRFK